DGNRVNEAEKSFATLKTKRPDGPFFNSEFWAGWFDHWGGPHAHTDTAIQAANLDWMLQLGYSVSIYMFHGGTDFGWMNGANSSDSKKDYEPDVTSYDYDSALEESGRPTAKFFAFRDVIAKATGVTPPPVPDVAPPIHVAAFKLTEAASLWDNLPKPIESDKPLTMEDIGQSYGWILYRTNFKFYSGNITIHDYAKPYMSDIVDEFDRRLSRSSFSLDKLNQRDNHFDLLVENSGRINYSHQLRTDRKGIVTYEAPAEGGPAKWQIYPLPMQDTSRIKFTTTACAGPCFYRGTFNVDKPADTFLDTSQLTKGQLWVNGHALGRFWNIGPQKTLYLPGPWLKKGANEVIVFDVDGHSSSSIEGLTVPNLGK
ncbi:MAG: beta-galactosidase, partial [Acidobacteriota bacterium]|nr:beta-galactosidase [Acidobacteriota bacterium]